MRRLVLLAFLLNSAIAVACEELLQSELPQITGTNHIFTEQALRHLKELRLQSSEVSRFIETNVVFALRGPERSFTSVVFEPNPRHADRGLRLDGWRESGRYVIHRIAFADRGEEMDYFRAIAARHGLQDEPVALEKSVFNCRQLSVAGWIQVKLWLKHRLNLNAVRDFFNGETEAPVLDFKHGVNRRPRYVIRGLTATGRRLLAVVGGEGRCPNVLVTAFEVQ